MSDAPRWGLTATIKAPAGDILRFAAWHLAQGAHRLYLYLDEPSEAFDTLKAHPKIRVTTCDETWWQKQGGKRPVKHQVRQSKNASHAYTRKRDVDWLIHMDVDEFLWPEDSVAAHLAALPDTVRTARIRPQEALGDASGLYKAHVPPGPDRARIVARLYPTFGEHLRGGFVSHTAGKVFVRTGLNDLTIRIHNAFQGEVMNPGETELPGIDLLHHHATTWDTWQAAYRFRIAKGSYRADLPAVLPAEKGGMNLHALLNWLEETEGPAGLRGFYDEVISGQGALPGRLETEGLLRRREMPVSALVAKHFHGIPPDWADSP
ncbi:MAG: glycosyltransferase family 2 protein [Marinibacterium sp.]